MGVTQGKLLSPTIFNMDCKCGDLPLGYSGGREICSTIGVQGIGVDSCHDIIHG